MGYVGHVLIDLDLDATPIAGHITSDQSARRPFHGWLELSSAIEQRRTAGPATAGPSARPVEPLPSAPDGDSLQASCGAPYTCVPRSGAQRRAVSKLSSSGGRSLAG